MSQLTNRLVKLQGEWRFYLSRNANGVELVAPLKRKRLLLSGLDSNAVLAVLWELSAGVPEDNLIGHLAQVSGLGSHSLQQLLGKLNSYDALLYTTEPIGLQDSGSQYDRQIRYFEAFATNERSAFAMNDNLQKRRVVIVGLGGYGTWLAMMAARMGIRHIIGIDFDHVELSNLNRQVLFTQQDVGRPKTEACAEAIAQIDPNVRFEGHNARINSPLDLISYLEGADLVFNSFGYSPPDFPANSVFQSISQAALVANVPCLHLGGSWIGPLTVPGETPCIECLFKNEKVADIARASFPHIDRPVPSIAPRMAITTGLAVWEAVRFLSKLDEPPSLRNLIILDLHNYTRHALLPIERSEECKLCGPIRKARRSEAP
ncbi:UBA/THIF-type NAD/FAD binding protein (plasmid) [Thermus thermophilus SG0.5JP17-16]|uniref:UBA/THIF-type NAD/FAD binding protein n=1 Tax=Thermus thermophilus (strain SG0.5JP17-16) TaxID=762633 RepID=F6DIW7_THETG|nr:ThiF family adenylyltransferase [Thermus thermophilus]AEG34364.1 UBA/THIF-type NAD/FAD binding protein [Thermus thermophilus SG0.5JP17-16]